MGKQPTPATGIYACNEERGISGIIRQAIRPRISCAGAILPESLSIALGANDFHPAKYCHAAWDAARSTKVVQA